MKIDQKFVNERNFSVNSDEINGFFHNESDVVKKGRSKLPKRLEDFVRVIIYFNFIDRLKAYKKRENLEIEIPVYDHSFWNRKNIIDKLSRLLWILYRREFAVTFIKETRTKGKTSSQMKLPNLKNRPLLLFSEGLDSIAAATEFKDATLVHIIKARYLGKHLEKIHSELFPNRRLEKITYVPGSNTRRDTGISNSRGMIFLGLASIHLYINKSNTLITGENGLMMYNPPLFEGAEPTRTMNPDFVITLEGLLTDIYGIKIRIKTPYKDMTKSEVLKIAKRNLKDKFEFAVQNSYSCFAQQPRGKGNKMCGRCYACILRQISLQSAVGKDNSQYEGNPFSENFSDDGKGIVNVMDLIRFAKGVLQNKLPYESYKIVNSNKPLFKRYAKEVISVIRRIPNKAEILQIESMKADKDI